MVDKRCFVQFPHPGGEHSPGRDGRIGWNELARGHRRKFMRLRGEWMDGDDRMCSGELDAWGEWEPESYVVERFGPRAGDPHAPRYLWRPYWVPRNSYRGLHNTDPFVFGGRFLYSNCGQPSPNKRGLKRLAQGSVIAFGSGRKVAGVRRWVLDTVLVVRDSVVYDPLDPRGALEGMVPETFLDVTGAPLAADAEGNPAEGCSATGELRLYRGATPDDPVHGMYSFFPARSARTGSDFGRPVVDLPGFINPTSWQAPKGAQRDLPPDVLRSLWEKLVAQVRDEGLVLGTFAELPDSSGGVAS